MNNEARCAKCSCTQIGVEYLQTKDVLLRTCKRCGYCWEELPDDNKAAAIRYVVYQNIQTSDGTFKIFNVNDAPAQTNFTNTVFGSLMSPERNNGSEKEGC